MVNPTPVDLVYNYIEPPGCLHDKAPIIFLHGMTASKENWNDIPDIVARSTRRKTYVVDERNHGDSPWTDVFNFDVNAIDVLKLMDRISAPSAVLIGHSMGGVAAFKTALRAPERVEKIVVEDMGVNQLPEDQMKEIMSYFTRAQSAIQKVPPTASEEDAIKIIIDHIYTPEIAQNLITKPDPKDFHLRVKKTESGEYTFKANMAAILKTIEKPHTLMADVTGEYKGPSRFIYGTSSSFNIISQKEDILKHFPHAEFVAMKDATHMVHNEKPKEYVEAVVEFLLKE